MQLMRVKPWISATFAEGSRPTTSTVNKWIERGEIPGRVIAGVTYVDANQFTQDLRNGPQAGPALREVSESMAAEMAAAELLR